MPVSHLPRSPGMLKVNVTLSPKGVSGGETEPVTANAGSIKVKNKKAR